MLFAFLNVVVPRIILDNSRMKVCDLDLKWCVIDFLEQLKDSFGIEIEYAVAERVETVVGTLAPAEIYPETFLHLKSLKLARVSPLKFRYTWRRNIDFSIDIMTSGRRRL